MTPRGLVAALVVGALAFGGVIGLVLVRSHDSIDANRSVLCAVGQLVEDTYRSSSVRLPGETPMEYQQRLLHYRQFIARLPNLDCQRLVPGFRPKGGPTSNPSGGGGQPGGGSPPPGDGNVIPQLPALPKLPPLPPIPRLPLPMHGHAGVLASAGTG